MLNEFFQDLPDGLREIVIQALMVVIALLLVWLLRRAATFAILRPLQRLAKRSNLPQDDKLVNAVTLPMRYFVIAAALAVTVAILNTGEALNAFVGRLISSAVIIGVILLLYRLVDIFAGSSNTMFRLFGLTIEERLLPFLRTSVKIFLVLLGVVIVLQEWGYNVNGLIAGIGVGGLALSLAAQDTAKNLIGFVTIIGDRPFDVGDYIITPDVEGIVEEVGIRSTRIRQLDQAYVTVPNSKLADAAVKNWSRLNKRRVDYMLGVTYDASSDDIRLLLHRIRELLNNWHSVEPGSVVVYFMEFGDSALNLLVRCYLTIPDWGEFQAEKEQVNLAVMDIVAELGMSVAFPSRSLYLENLPALAQNVEAMAQARLEAKRATLSPREQALLDEEARAARESAPAPPQLSPEEARQPGSDQDMPDEES